MNKSGKGWGLIVFLVFLTLVGVLAWAYYKDIKISDMVDFFTGRQSNHTSNFTDDEFPMCEVCQDFPDVDMMAYYFDNDTYKGFNIFLNNSKSYLYCGFTKLEDEAIALKLLALKNMGIDVKVHFGIEETMSSCDIICVPKLESSYDYLFGEGVDVSYSRLNFDFCVNERAVYLFSLSSDGIARNEYGMIIFNPEIREVYYGYFNEISG